MANELIKVNQGQHLPVNTFAELVEAGKLLATSQAFGAVNPAAGFLIVATCHQQGISLMEFHRTYHMVDGKPSMRADAMLAEFRKKGGRYKIIENSMTRAAIEATFEGQTLTFEYTIEDGHRTKDALTGKGAVKDNWQKRPDDMMWARVISKMVRRLCPEINAGLYSPEEMQDFDGNAARREAVPISPEEAVRRAKPVQAEVGEPLQENHGNGYWVCPDGFGDYSGQSWETMTDELLNMALASRDLTDEHKRNIESVLNGRKAKP